MATTELSAIVGETRRRGLVAGGVATSTLLLVVGRRRHDDTKHQVRTLERRLDRLERAVGRD